MDWLLIPQELLVNNELLIFTNYLSLKTASLSLSFSARKKKLINFGKWKFPSSHILFLQILG